MRSPPNLGQHASNFATFRQADSITEIAPKPGFLNRFGFGSKWGKILLKNWDYGWFDHEKFINWIGTNRDSSKMGWSGLQSKPIFWTPVHTLCPELRTPCSARCFPLPSVSDVENRWIIRTRNCQTLVTWTSTTILPWIPSTTLCQELIFSIMNHWASSVCSCHHQE